MTTRPMRDKADRLCCPAASQRVASQPGCSSQSQGPFNHCSEVWYLAPWRPGLTALRMAVPVLVNRALVDFGPVAGSSR